MPSGRATTRTLESCPRSNASAAELPLTTRREQASFEHLQRRSKDHALRLFSRHQAAECTPTPSRCERSPGDAAPAAGTAARRLAEPFSALGAGHPHLPRSQRLPIVATSIRPQQVCRPLTAAGTQATTLVVALRKRERLVPLRAVQGELAWPATLGVASLTPVPRGIGIRSRSGNSGNGRR